MPAFFRSNLRRALADRDRVAHNMLTAAAVVVENQAKRNVRGGFKSGEFVTGNIMNKITHQVDRKRMVAEVGTTVDYGAFWELGHHNTFTRKYEREEWLKPAMTKTTREQQRAAERAAQRTR